MAYLDDLRTRRDNIANELATMTSTSAGGKPDAAKSGIGHVAYRTSLLQELRELKELIHQAELDEIQQSGGFMVVSEIVP